MYIPHDSDRMQPNMFVSKFIIKLILNQKNKIKVNDESSFKNYEFNF